MFAPAIDETGAAQSCVEDQEQNPLALTPVRNTFDTFRTADSGWEHPSPVSPGTSIQRHIGSLDPFSTGGLQIDSKVASLLQYFETTWAQTAFQSATASKQLQRYNRSETMQLIRGSLADPLVAHAFLAAVAMRMATVHNTYSSAEHYAATALCQLRNSIRQEDDNRERIMLSILFLAAYETYCFNLEGTKTHLRALKRMSAQNYLTGYLKTLCQHVDLFSASSSLTPPIFSMPLPLAIYTEVSGPTTVGRGFLGYTETLGTKMSAVIANIIACANVAEAYKRRVGSDEDLGFKVAKMVEWSESLTYKLLDQMPGSLLKESCIIALLMWLSYLPASIMASSNTNTPPTPGQSFLKMIPGRGTGLVKRLAAALPLDTHLHLWILAVGIVCAVDQDDTAFCAVHFIRLAHQLEVRQAQLQECLRQFLWLDHFDLIDCHVLMQLLREPEASAEAMRIVIGWAATTKGGSPVSSVGSGRGGEKESHVRVTNRPSNWYRLGA